MTDRWTPYCLGYQNKISSRKGKCVGAVFVKWVLFKQADSSRVRPVELREVHNTPSRFRQGPLEGVVVRRENADWLERRAKLVRADFTQAIDGHWRSRTLEWNRVEAQAAG